jgi:hypothetical protein
MGDREDSPWLPPPPVADSPAPSVLPRARALGRHGVTDQEAEAELGGRFIPDNVRAYVRLEGSDPSARPAALVCALVCALMFVSMSLRGTLPVAGQLLLAVLALAFGLLAARSGRTQSRLADERVRFLQYGIVVVPEVRTVAKDALHRTWETRISYEYSVNGTKHVHTMVRPYPQPLWNPFQLIYDPAQPTEPRIVRDLYPDLVVEADAVRLR